MKGLLSGPGARAAPKSGAPDPVVAGPPALILKEIQWVNLTKGGPFPYTRRLPVAS